MIDLDGTVQKCEEENKLGDSIASKVTPGAGVSTDSTTQSYYPGDWIYPSQIAPSPRAPLCGANNLSTSLMVVFGEIGTSVYYAVAPLPQPLTLTRPFVGETIPPYITL